MAPTAPHEPYGQQLLDGHGGCKVVRGGTDEADVVLVVVLSRVVFCPHPSYVRWDRHLERTKRTSTQRHDSRKGPRRTPQHLTPSTNTHTQRAWPSRSAKTVRCSQLTSRHKGPCHLNTACQCKTHRTPTIASAQCQQQRLPQPQSRWRTTADPQRNSCQRLGCWA